MVFGWVDWWWRSTSPPHTTQLHVRKKVTEIKLFIVFCIELISNEYRQYASVLSLLSFPVAQVFWLLCVCLRIRCSVLRPFYNALLRSCCCVCHRLFSFILSHIVIRHIHSFIYYYDYVIPADVRCIDGVWVREWVHAEHVYKIEFQSEYGIVGYFVCKLMIWLMNTQFHSTVFNFIVQLKI